MSLEPALLLSAKTKRQQDAVVEGEEHLQNLPILGIRAGLVDHLQEKLDKQGTERQCYCELKR